jgi:hypothetical protein
MVKINEAWLRENINDKADLTYYSRFAEYANKPMGIFRIVQSWQKTLNLGRELIQAPLPAVKKLSGKLGGAVGALGVLRTPFAVEGAIESASAFHTDTEINLERRALNAMGNATDAISSCCYSHAFITGNPALITMARMADLTTDVIDLKKSSEDYAKASALEATAAGDIKVAVSHTKNYQFFRILKAVASVAAAIFGFALLALGLPLVAILTDTLVSTLFAVMRDLYKDMGRFKVIDFDREVSLI